MPTTATIAAMPIAMPSADRNARIGRVRSPTAPTRTTSAQAQRGAGASAGVTVRSVTSRTVLEPITRRRASGPAGAAPAAISRSWVITTTVVPAACSSRSSCHHPGAGRGVEVAGRLVGQQQRRVADHRPGDRRPAAARRRTARAAGGRAGARGRPAPARPRPAAAAPPAGRPGRAGRRPRCPAPRTPAARWNCWNTKPIRVARSADSSRSDSRATSCPSIRTVPAVGRSRVPIRCSIVDLPEPDGPTIATSSPRVDPQADPAERGRRRPGTPWSPRSARSLRASPPSVPSAMTRRR